LAYGEKMTDYEVGTRSRRGIRSSKKAITAIQGRGKRRIPPEGEMIRTLLNSLVEFREGGKSNEQLALRF